MFRLLPYYSNNLAIIERTFQREYSPLTLLVMTEIQFLLWKNLKNVMHGHVKMYVMP